MKSRLFRVALLLGGLGMVGCAKGAQYPQTSAFHPEIDDSLPLSFEFSAKNVAASCNAEIADFSRRMDAIAALPATARTFVAVVREMELLRAESSNRLRPINFLQYVSPEEDVRSAAGECEMKLSQSLVELYAREDLYRVVRSVVEKNEKLDARDAQLLRSTVQRFVRSGLEFSPERRNLFITTRKTLIQLESRFKTNLDEWQDGLLVSRKELAGLSADYVATLEHAPEGKYLVTLDYPHYFSFMEEARDADARKRLEYKFNRRGGLQNVKLLERALRLRQELATMLGYKNYAEYMLDRAMAQTPARVNEFLEKIEAARRKSVEADLQEMLATKKRDVGMPCAERIESWDLRYYDNRLRKAKYGIELQKLKEWFPLDTVIHGMFSIYETLFGVQFVPVEGPKWHEDVKLFRVMQQGQIRAYFYLDLFPRKGKYGHAASFTLLNGMQERNGAYRAPISAIVANLTTPAEDHERLLTLDEMETLFHEFGHIMHQTLTTVRYASFSGTNVKQDFVETPSKMFEMWLWQPATLKLMSGHYRTGKRLSDDVLQRIVASKLHDAMGRHLRQAALATVDMIYHTSPYVDTTAVYARVMRDIRMVPIQEGTYPQASFEHLMNGYGAAYYSYLWSEAVAADMFGRFKREGLTNPGVGADFRQWILEPGCTRDPYKLVHGFLGREPNPDALWQ